VLDKPNKNTFSLAIQKGEEMTKATPQELRLVEKTLDEQKPLIEPIKRKVFSKPKGPNPKSVKKSKKVKPKERKNNKEKEKENNNIEEENEVKDTHEEHTPHKKRKYIDEETIITVDAETEPKPKKRKRSRNKKTNINNTIIITTNEAKKY